MKTKRFLMAGLVAVALAASCVGTPSEEDLVGEAQQAYTTQDANAAWALQSLFISRGCVPYVVQATKPGTYGGETVLAVTVKPGMQNAACLSPQKTDGYDYDTGAGFVHYKVAIYTAGQPAVFQSISA